MLASEILGPNGWKISIIEQLTPHDRKKWLCFLSNFRGCQAFKEKSHNAY